MKHENNFDLLRLAAAAQVMIGHGTVPLEYNFTPVFLKLYTLFPGVAIFFVISGFLVTQSFVERGGLLRFAWARCLRIYPGLALNLLFMRLPRFDGHGLGHKKGSNHEQEQQSRGNAPAV